MRSNIFLALGLGLALAGCQKEEASPASGPGAAATAQQAPAQQPWVWRAWPFDPNSSRVELDPASGKVQLTSPRMFAEWFDKKLPELRKGEFETTPDYKERVGDVDTALAPITSGDVYLFPPDSIYSTYDADREVFKPSDFACYEFESEGRFYQCRLHTEKAKLDEYRGKDFYAAVPSQAFRKYEKSEALNLTVECPIPKAEAPGMKDVVQFAYGFRFISGEPISLGIRFEDERTAFDKDGLVAEPVLALCYDKRDGKVLHVKRFEASK